MPANTNFKTRSVARRPHVRGACPALVIGEGQVSTEEEKISAWRGLRTVEERDSWRGSRVAPEGINFFPREDLCKLLFVRIFLFLSLVKVKFGLAPFVIVQYATACDQGLSAETCNAS